MNKKRVSRILIVFSIWIAWSDDSAASQATRARRVQKRRSGKGRVSRQPMRRQMETGAPIRPFLRTFTDEEKAVLATAEIKPLLSLSHRSFAYNKKFDELKALAQERLNVEVPLLSDQGISKKIELQNKQKRGIFLTQKERALLSRLETFGAEPLTAGEEKRLAEITQKKELLSPKERAELAFLRTRKESEVVAPSYTPEAPKPPMGIREPMKESVTVAKGMVSTGTSPITSEEFEALRGRSSTLVERVTGAPIRVVTKVAGTPEATPEVGTPETPKPAEVETPKPAGKPATPEATPKAPEVEPAKPAGTPPPPPPLPPLGWKPGDKTPVEGIKPKEALADKPAGKPAKPAGTPPPPPPLPPLGWKPGDKTPVEGIKPKEALADKLAGKPAGTPLPATTKKPIDIALGRLKSVQEGVTGEVAQELGVVGDKTTVDELVVLHKDLLNSYAEGNVAAFKKALTSIKAFKNKKFLNERKGTKGADFVSELEGLEALGSESKVALADKLKDTKPSELPLFFEPIKVLIEHEAAALKKEGKGATAAGKKPAEKPATPPAAPTLEEGLKAALAALKPLKPKAPSEKASATLTGAKSILETKGVSAAIIKEFENVMEPFYEEDDFDYQDKNMKEYEDLARAIALTSLSDNFDEVNAAYESLRGKCSGSTCSTIMTSLLDNWNKSEDRSPAAIAGFLKDYKITGIIGTVLPGSYFNRLKKLVDAVVKHLETKGFAAAS